MNVPVDQSQVVSAPVEIKLDGSSTPQEFYRARARSVHFAVQGFLAVLLFILALLVALRQNWQADCASTAMIYDAGHYQVTVQLIVAQVLEWAQRIPANAGAALGLDPKQLAPHLLLDGPLLPLCSAALWILLGHIPTAAEWRTFIGLESCCHAASTVLIFLLAGRFVRNLPALALRAKVGWLPVVPAVIWMLYPSAVMGAGAFMTEVPTATALLIILYSGARLLEVLRTDEYVRLGSHVAPTVWASVLGITTGLVFVSKQALAPGLFVIFVLFGVYSFVHRTRSNLDPPGSTAVKASSGFNRDRLSSLIAPFAALGLTVAVVVGAWACWTKATTGQVYLGAYRLPTFNVVKGTEPTTDGWGTFPQTPTAMMYPESVPPGKAFADIWKNHAPACANLYLRKAERLWGLPWNDYHYKFFGISIPLQIWWHRLLIVFGSVGAIVFLENRVRGIRKQQLPVSTELELRVEPGSQPDGTLADFIGWGCLALIFCHGVFVPFETMSRYGFTSMPFLILLSVLPFGYSFKRTLAGVSIDVRSIANVMAFTLFANIAIATCQPDFVGLVATLSHGAASPQWTAWLVQSTAFFLLAICAARLVSGWRIAIPFILVAFVAISSLAHVLHKDDLREWSANLRAGDSASRFINLDAAKPDWILLLVDGDKNVENCSVAVNGRALTDKPKSLVLFNTERSVMLDGLQLWARLCRQPLEAMRQWRAVPVPLEYLHFGDGQVNKLTLHADTACGATVYGDYPGINGLISLPSLKYLSGGRSLHEIQSYDMRTIEDGRAFATDAKCALECVRTSGKYAWPHDLSPSVGRQFGQYRLYMLLGYRTALDEATVDAEPQSCPIPICKQTHAMDLSKPIEFNKALNKTEQLRVSLHVPAPELESSKITSGQFLIEGIAGEKIFFPGEAKGFDDEPSQTSQSTANKVLIVDVPRGAFPDGISAVRFSLRSATGSFTVHNLQLRVEPLHLPNFENHRIELR